MTGENGNDFFWNEWQDILLAEFERRVVAVGVKGQGIVVPASKNLTVLFLQVKGFSVPSADILPEAIRTVRENDALQPGISSFIKEYDAIAMMGHRIGMVDNSTQLKQYLQDVRPVLTLEGQILLTSLDVHAVSEPEHRVNQTLSKKQFQQVNLIGPFFSMLRIKAGNLKSLAVAANWHCELIYCQDENNYLVRITPV
jgi:predicted HAD superfamily phosphohydrolase